ncbi:ATP-binding protein [Mesorhizobium sp. LjNodule214]|uniref:ATP-binding protein n=1 Tax=Mesorhizobium sp. LjNodule214 TaxID=3342252 RepID=UPI003ED106E5
MARVEGISGVETVLRAQRKYADLKHWESQIGLTIPEAFVRGIRHIGYRRNVDAIAELIDNSIQAYSQRVDLVFGYDEGVSLKKPTQIAVIDDGHGMASEMLKLAMMWGGTHREDDRTGLGRYGFGLPSSAVSIGRRFTIVSKVLGGPLFAATLDLDALVAGKYRNSAGDVALPSPLRARLPAFINEHLGRTFPQGWHSGTIVLIEKLDRLDWATTLGMRTNLVRHFGVTYHKLLNQTAIHVDGRRVPPIDPLFLTPECEFYSLDEDRAKPLDRIDIKVRNLAAADREGQVSLRYAWLPPTFGAIDKARDAVGLNANARFPILKDYHGLIFSRNGRIIDVQSRAPWTLFINNDRYIRVEVEFSASLDEMFGVTTSKQQVSVSSAVWDALRQAGLPKAIEQLRGKVRSAKLEGRSVNGLRASPTGLEESSKALGLRGHRRPERAVALLIRDTTSLILSPSERHPLFNGTASTLETARALRALVGHIINRAGLAGGRRRSDYEFLLEDWSDELALTLVNEAPQIPGRTDDMCPAD